MTPDVLALLAGAADELEQLERLVCPAIHELISALAAAKRHLARQTGAAHPAGRLRRHGLAADRCHLGDSWKGESLTAIGQWQRRWGRSSFIFLTNGPAGNVRRLHVGP